MLLSSTPGWCLERCQPTCYSVKELPDYSRSLQLSLSLWGIQVLFQFLAHHFRSANRNPVGGDLLLYKGVRARPRFSERHELARFQARLFCMALRDRKEGGPKGQGEAQPFRSSWFFM